MGLPFDFLLISQLQGNPGMLVGCPEGLPAVVGCNGETWILPDAHQVHGSKCMNKMSS